jgi:hypothetical protein
LLADENQKTPTNVEVFFVGAAGFEPYILFYNGIGKIMYIMIDY